MILKYNFSGLEPEAGCDEAGRGCLAGPVVAAAVVLKPDFSHPLLNDSKKVSKANREELKAIIEAEAVSWGIGICSPGEIDEINILNASILAMHRAITALNVYPEFLIIDGNRFKKFGNIPHQTVVKGDSKYTSIAAASILAKTHRDAIMTDLHGEFECYDWRKNKGYPTLTHREAIARHGISKWHRKTFRLLKTQMELPFLEI